MDSQEDNQEQQPANDGKKVRVPRSQGMKNKSLGYGTEREYAIIFRDYGFDKCKTTRHTSRLMDSCKIDLNFLPVNVQLKAGHQKGMQPSAILKEMEELLIEHYPETDPIHDLPKMLIHHKPKPKGVKKRTQYDVMVSMTFKDLMPLILAYNKQKQDDYQSNKRRNQ